MAKPRKRSPPPRKRSALLFLDTNILLDFYRVSEPRNSLRLLDRLDQYHGVLITTFEVEMEFKKHRQRYIVEAFDRLTTPKFEVPIFLEPQTPDDSSQVQQTLTALTELRTLLQARIEELLDDPRLDRVYRSAEAIFRSDSVCNLTLGHEDEKDVVARAQRRFDLGFPPRKEKGGSCGDGVNWEWILLCARRQEKDVVLVSRDSDFGSPSINRINDWLSEEFARFTKREIYLTERLADGLRWAGLTVTKEEEKEEDSFVRAEKLLDSRMALLALLPPEQREQTLKDLAELRNRAGGIVEAWDHLRTVLREAIADRINRAPDEK